MNDGYLILIIVIIAAVGSGLWWVYINDRGKR